MNNKAVVLFLIVLVISFTACKRGKKSGDNDTSAVDSTYITADTFSNNIDKDIVIPDISDDKKELAKRVYPLWKSILTFNTFKGKAKMHYEGMGQKQDFTANIRMTRDSAIWIQITAGMGIVNVARIMVTPDSIRMVNYLEKNYMLMPADDATKLLPATIDFEILQDLLIGNVLSRDGVVAEVTELPQFWNLQTVDSSMSQQLTYNKADSTLHTLQMLAINDKSNVAGRILYKDYEMVEAKKFATGRVVNINDNGRTHYLEMNFNNAEFDVPMSYPFSIPSSYELKN